MRQHAAGAALILTGILCFGLRAEPAAPDEPRLAAARAAALQDLRSWRSGRRLKAVAALEKAGGPEAAAALTGALADRDADVRLAAAQAVARGGGDGRAVALVPLLKDKKAAVRKAAIAGLSSAGDEAALLGLALASRDPDDGLRSYAVERFAQLKGSQPAALLSLFLDDDEESVRREAVERLGVLKDDAAVPMLARVLVKDDSRKLRIAAVHGLGSIGTPEAAHAVARGLEDEDAWVRRRAVETLGSLQDPAGVLPLARLIPREKDPGVKEAAIDALAEIGDVRAIPGLNEVVFKGGRELRPAAEKAVKRIIARRRPAQASEAEVSVAGDSWYCRVAPRSGASAGAGRSAKKAFKEGDYLESLAAAQTALAGDPGNRGNTRIREESQRLLAGSLVQRSLSAESARREGDPGPSQRHCGDLDRIATDHPMIRFLQGRCAAAAAADLAREVAALVEVSSSAPAAVESPVSVSNGPAAAAAAPAATASVEPAQQAARSHRFEKGDSLWSLAVKYYGAGSAWKAILDANQERIKDPSGIELGTELLIP